MRNKILVFLIVGGGIAFLTLTSLLGWPGTSKIDFNTQIRPILNANCTSCHGGVKEQGGISLLYRESALLKGKSGKPCIVPGSPAESELIKRLTHHDLDERMPLKAPPLSKEQISLLEKWVEEGAQWETHWAYVAPKPQEVPFVLSTWPTADLDKFVYKKMADAGMSPSPQADKATLLRRLTLDLTGVAPTPEAYTNFINNTSDEAYEKAVDSLLASPNYGERWTAMWLDLARYGDSQGYQKDRHRDIWQYRDWLIEAFNNDMPFDQFTVEQLAGDLLPKPTTDQLIATAFNRNTSTNDEGGTDDEEFRVVAVLDRVNTTMEVWQGTTIACVQCHSHPYDPFPHREYYQLMSFFNTTADTDLTNDYPTLRKLSSIQQTKFNEAFRQFESITDTASTAYLKACAELDAIKPSNTPVMEELPVDSTRRSFMFVRGNWMVHGKEVFPQTPKMLSLMPKDLSKDRLGLARWLVSPQNPLTARVMVNRFWEQLYGRGLVETLEDFGTQGSKPTHPKLLDWLALRLMNEHQWSIKAMLKEMVMSATYRQSSVLNDDLQENDPYNLYLARGPRVRLSAEQIRDQALSVSGLMTNKLYGPSVMPPQPDGVWQVIRNVIRWRSAQDENRYRRAIYTYWRKSSPYPSFTTFDAPSRELCVSRRIRTNTPLQALVTLNDPVYLEVSQALAWEVKQSLGLAPRQNIRQAYFRLTGHYPSKQRLELLVNYYLTSIDYYRKSPADVRDYVTMPYPKTPHLAALSATTNVMLNLDEVVTKE